VCSIFFFIHVMKVLLFVKCVYVLSHILEYLGKTFSFLFFFVLTLGFQLQKVGLSLIFILVDAYGAAGSIGFGTCCIDSGCTEHSLFISPSIVRQRHKEAEGRLLHEITLVVLLVLK